MSTPSTNWTTRDLAEPALRAFFRLAEVWDLSQTEQMILLGLRAHSTLHSWKTGNVRRVNRDTIERISYLLGIFKGINILFSDELRADAWMRKPNAAPPFGGRSALDRMLCGNVSDLYEVRRYLDAQI